MDTGVGMVHSGPLTYQWSIDHSKEPQRLACGKYNKEEERCLNTWRGIWSRTWIGLTLFLVIPLSARFCWGIWESGSVGIGAGKGGGWNSHYQCQPNPGPGPHASPCINNSRITLQVTQFLVQSGTEEVHRGYCTYLAADINILEIRSSQLHCMQ